MKKIVYTLCVLSMTALIALIGCKKSSEEPIKDEQIVGSWEIHRVEGSIIIDILGKPITVPIKGTLSEVAVIVEDFKKLVPEDKREILNTITAMIDLAKMADIKFNSDHTFAGTNIPIYGMMLGTWSLSGNDVTVKYLDDLKEQSLILNYTDGKLNYHLITEDKEGMSSDITIILAKK